MDARFVNDSRMLHIQQAMIATMAAGCERFQYRPIMNMKNSGMNQEKPQVMAAFV